VVKLSVYELTSIDNRHSWTRSTTIEDRKNIREKIKSAYRSNIVGESVEDLLDLVVLVDEDLLLSSSSNRLEYYKMALQWDHTVSKKRSQLHLDKDNCNSATVEVEENVLKIVFIFYVCIDNFFHC
jgi:hypothetical protein